MIKLTTNNYVNVKKMKTKNVDKKQDNSLGLFQPKQIYLHKLHFPGQKPLKTFSSSCVVQKSSKKKKKKKR